MKYLHTMIRVSDPDATIRFFELLGLKEVNRYEVEAGRFTLIFLLGILVVTWLWANARSYAAIPVRHVMVDRPCPDLTCHARAIAADLSGDHQELSCPHGRVHSTTCGRYIMMACDCPPFQ